VTVTLFRQEAIDAQTPKLFGDVTLSTPLPTKTCVAFLALSALGLAGFVATGSYARKTHAPGFIAAQAGVANIVAPRAGVIEKIFVREGATVRQGDPLIAVRVEQNALDGAGADSAMLKTLRLQHGNIEEQIALERDKIEATAKRLKAEIVAIDADLAVMEQQKDLLARKAALAEAQVANIAGLVAQHIVAEPELNRRRDAVLSVQQAVLDLQRAAAARVAERESKRDDLAQLPLTAKRTIAQLKTGLTETQLKIQQIEAQRGYLITAPKDGRVSALQAWTGRTIDANMPQMSVAPVDDVVRAELFVPAESIGALAPGQTVNLDLASFPYQKFGFVAGVVDTVSTTLLKPDQTVGPIALAAPAYRVSVTLKQQTIQAYGQEVALKADMQLAADIVSDRRNLFNWLIDPLRAALRKSF
jgi:membrane fusion protein